MDISIKQVLDELEAFGVENDAVQTERSKKLLNLEPETAHLLSIIARSSKRKHLLEIGTSNGYSTIWLAWCARATGGHVISIDNNPEKTTMAQSNLERTGLRGLVTLKTGNAADILQELTEPIDFVFLDADRGSYPAYFDLLLPKLSPDALILADNVNSHPDEIAGYIKLISEREDFDHVVVDVGKGLSVAYQQ